ncbi:hypothetical protein FHL15_008309 [Xylaria flabelliformis]|uniref:Methylitaconate delta2-delta3-isomerase n=1 Tax=Xylaria flabelliformis TaxID=2512241 RepID=A0A553HRZ2_9PEZI|nr:hypothetical protein FHL15_008309 [Xylaria flabelliformis]
MSPQALKKGQRSLPALFVRSGTSTGLVLRASDLPPSTDEWADILPAAMGSPDPLHGRQLDGMGGGISSTSKICVLAPSKRGDADVDFTFVQVGVRDGRLDLAGNCGNMSAVVGPVAWDWGFVSEGEKKGKIKTVVVVRGEKEEEEEEEEYSEALVRIFNTNTSKIMHARFRVQGEPPVYCPAGQYSMDGVPGTQSRITLSFVDPAGAKTGRALPTGNAVDVLELPDGSTVRASLVDVSNPGVFVALDELGLGHHHHHHHISPDTFHPAAVEADEVLKERLEMIRRAGAALMGLDPEVESVPKIVLLFPRNSKKGHSGDKDEVDIRCLAMSMGQAHKAAPLTLALCLGAAANIDGTVAAQIRRRRDNHRGNSSSVVIGHPSGTVEIGATFEDGNIVSADLHRTARVLMKGEVYY